MMTTHAERSNIVSVQAKPAPAGSHIGGLLIDAGRINPQDAERILRYAKERNIRFGDAATELGLVTRAEIDQIIAQQFDYPYLTPGSSQVSPEVIAAYTPFSDQVEALRALRSQLLLRWFEKETEQNKLAVVSSDRGDGRSYLAANLAVVCSQLGERTLLVDADLRNSRQHTLFGLANGIGLSTILSGRANLDAIQRVSAFVALSVLPAGPNPPNPQELVNRGGFSSLMSDVGKQYDVVIIDTAADNVSADAHTIAAQVGGALLLTRANRTKLDRVKSLSDGLTASGVTVVGAVLNER